MKAESRPKKIGKLDVQARKLVGLVDYQAGSVVSRVILKAKTGTVTCLRSTRGRG
jgi:hypothetical protein